MEILLSGGYSSVHTRLGFDPGMFIPKNAEYMKKKDDIIEQLRNLYGEKNEKSEKKRLNQLLYDLFKQEDLNSCNKPIYSLYLDGENEFKKGRVFSKIFKLAENNHYGFAMTKPLPIGIFKKEPSLSMEILYKSIENFNPNAKIGEIFVVDIEFDPYNDPREEMYIKVFPCIFKPKSKVPVDKQSFYHLLSTMRTRKSENILKYKATEKTHATLRPKKRFPMYIDHIQRRPDGRSVKYICTKLLNRSLLKKNSLSVIRGLDRRPWPEVMTCKLTFGSS